MTEIENQVSAGTAAIFSSEFLKTQMDRMAIKYKIVHSPLKPNKFLEFYRLNVLPQPFVENTEAEQIIIEINDDLFVALAEPQQFLVAEKIWAKVWVDSETGNLKKASEDFREFSLIVQKHGHETIEALKLSIAQQRDKLKDEGKL